MASAILENRFTRSERKTGNRRITRSEFQKQLVRTNAKRLGYLKENFNAGGTLAALNPAYIIRMNVGLFRKGLLAEACFLAAPKHGFANDFTLRFRHRNLRKQKREKATTHAQCSICLFAPAFQPVSCKTDLAESGSYGEFRRTSKFNRKTMKILPRAIFLAALIQFFFVGHSFGVVDQSIQVQGTNLVLSWPSLGYESYLIQYRPTLDPPTPCQELTNAYPANSTNRSTFTIPCCALVALGGGSSMMSLSGGGSSRAATHVVESKVADLRLWAAPADGSGVAIPLVLYPPGFNAKDLVIVEGPELPIKTQSIFRLGGEAPENEPGAAMMISNGGCDCPDMGFFRVFHIPDFPASITNFTFDGPVFIPVDFKDYMERVENLEALVDGEDTHISEFTSAYYNSKTNWGMGVYFDRLANGTHQIQLRSKIRMTDDISGDTPMLVTSNLTRSILVDNAVTFTNWDDLVWNNTHYTFRAQLKVSQADWWIDIYDAWGE